MIEERKRQAEEERIKKEEAEKKKQEAKQKKKEEEEKKKAEGLEEKKEEERKIPLKTKITEAFWSSVDAVLKPFEDRMDSVLGVTIDPFTGKLLI